MREFEELYSKIEESIKNDKLNSLDTRDRSWALSYLKNLKKFLARYDTDNELIKNRICNDTIFTELVFDKILKSFNSDDKSLAITYMAKECIRFRLFNDYVTDKNPFFNCVTQESACNLLVEYMVAHLSNTGKKEKRIYTFDDVKLDENDLDKISCLVVREEELEMIDDKEKMI